MLKVNKIVGSVHCPVVHNGDDGITFSVTDTEEGGPTIQIESISAGNLVTQMSVFADKPTLAKIGKMFLDASGQEFSEEYTNKVSAE
jgi:hypothetical protein